MTNPSQILFPIVTPEEGTINEVDQNGNTVYDALRLQFLITGNTFDERNITKTICLFLKSNLCTDKVITYDGSDFQMEQNNSDIPFMKVKRIYGLYSNFINTCMDPMIRNMEQVFANTPIDTDEHKEIRSRLCMKWSMLEELKIKYLEHSEAMKIIEMIKYLI